MGLTDAIQRPDARTAIDTNFEKPAFSADGALLAKPQTENYGLMGSAFTYLATLTLWEHDQTVDTEPFPTTQAIQRARQLDAEEKVTDAIEHSFGRVTSFSKGGALSDDACQGILDLARLSIIARDNDARARHSIDNLGTYDRGDIDDLYELHEAIPEEVFDGADALYPRLGVGGAYGSKDTPVTHIDLVTDTTLIDYRTSQYLKLDKQHWRKLVAKVALYETTRLQAREDYPEIESVGVYFSRYGTLWTVGLGQYPVADIASSLSEFLIA